MLYNEQSLLVLAVSLPCLAISITSMIMADFSGYLIAFITIVLVLVCFFVIATYKNRAEYRVRTLSNLIESMIDGDYSLRGKLQTDQAYRELLNLINDLADTLAKHKVEARESKILLERILGQMNAMVLAVDPNHKVIMANASADKLCPSTLSSLVGANINDFAVGTQLATSDGGIIEFEDAKLSGEYFLVKERFLSEGKAHQLYLLTNAERLLMEKERQAWQSLIRVLSHEMNNSLAPISAISQSMTKKIAKIDDKSQRESLDEGIAIISERSDSLSEFIARYTELSHLPKASKSVVNLQEVLARATALFTDFAIQIEPSCNREVTIDVRQVEQMLINLIKNAKEAMNHQAEKKAKLFCIDDGDVWQLVIEDFGSGIANTDNLFVPFYTTKKHGSGIGLALCRQIMFNHNGNIKLVNKPDSTGCKVYLSFPQC